MKHFRPAQELVSAETIAAPPRATGRDLYADGAKRVFDLVLAALCLPVVAPVILVLAAIVARDGGSPFFGHRRIGRGGRAFRCWKIRTMVPDAEARIERLVASDPAKAEQWRRYRKLDGDPRVTRLGGFLRRTSLDELPQILNVLTGEMSFVGPRPVTEPEMEHYDGFRAHYYALRPGITGLWQVTGRDVVTYEERVRIDVSYQKRLSFGLDLWILARTTTVVLRPTGS